MDIISVIVPFYNGNKYLENIRNLIERNVITAKSEIDIEVELILVNDSPWVSIEKEKIQSSLYKLILVELQDNGGIHNARVKGLEVANGKYIAFLDQDDLWCEAFIRETYKLICCEECDCVIANGVFETSKGKRMILNSYGRVFFSRKYYAYLIIGNLLSSPGQCLLRKDEIPDFWKENIMKTNCSDDLYLWCLMFKEIKIKYCNQLLYTHVDTGENCSLDKRKGYESDLEMYNLLTKENTISKIWLTIFKWRYDYNMAKLTEKNKHITYYLYSTILHTFKMLIIFVSGFGKLFGKRILEK
ncbi:MAG: glycosyltransferase family 2 protein [Lachnospiraceae bacterium]|nr:glycosyltransferase family 2 protein [Lachnospiraceae bacterium]